MIGRADYEEKKQRRIERMRARAEKKRAEGQRSVEQAEQIARHIPLGQPILVGHHSEKRHRRDLDRINKGYERGWDAQKQADRLESRANTAESNIAISSDDPEAIEKLREKLSKLEEERDLIKRINKAYRQGGAAAAEAIVPKKVAPRLHWGSVRLPNIGAEIRRCKARIATLEKAAERSEKEPEQYGDVRIEENDNRVQVFFPGKPSADVRKQLKSHGFRWAPSVGAWQRMASDGAWYWARVIVDPSTHGKGS